MDDSQILFLVHYNVISTFSTKVWNLTIPFKEGVWLNFYEIGYHLGKKYERNKNSVHTTRQSNYTREHFAALS